MICYEPITSKSLGNSIEVKPEAGRIMDRLEPNQIILREHIPQALAATGVPVEPIR